MKYLDPGGDEPARVPIIDPSNGHEFSCPRTAPQQQCSQSFYIKLFRRLIERRDEPRKTARPSILNLVSAGGKGRQVDNSCCEEPERKDNDEERRRGRSVVAKTGERKKNKKKDQPGSAIRQQKTDHQNE